MRYNLYRIRQWCKGYETLSRWEWVLLDGSGIKL